jgi:hypothetical protein
MNGFITRRLDFTSFIVIDESGRCLPATGAALKAAYFCKIAPPVVDSGLAFVLI